MGMLGLSLETKMIQVVPHTAWPKECALKRKVPGAHSNVVLSNQKR
jgi:hypothetical protein